MDVHVSDSQREAPKNICFLGLEYLIEQRYDAQLKAILNITPSLISIVDSTNRTLLHAATEHDNFKMTKYLIKLGCDIDAKTFTGWTPLMIIANSRGQYYYSCIMELLLNHGADMFATNSLGESVLQIYLRNFRRNRVLIQTVVEKVKIRSTNNEDLLDIFLKAGGQLESIVHLRNVEITKKFLDRRGCTHDHPPYDCYDDQAVVCCMELGYEENLRVLLQYGGEIEIKCRRECFIDNMLEIAAGYIHVNQLLKTFEIFTQLLIDIEILDKTNNVVIGWIITYATRQALSELLKTELISYTKSKFNYEPLTYVFGNWNPGIFNLIQENVFDVNMRGHAGTSTLHEALSHGVIEHIEYLLDNNLDANITNNYGETPIIYAFFNATFPNRNACVTLLLKYNADIQVCDRRGKTIVEYAQHIPENEQTFKTILTHLAVLQSKGIPLKAQFVNFIKSSEKLTKFYKEMCQQLEKMKTHSIHRSLTLFTVLTQSYDVISHHLKTIHPDVVKNLSSREDLNLVDYDTYYTDIIRDRITLAYKIYETRKAASEVIYDCIDQLKGYSVVVDKLCSFLSLDHLHKIVYSSCGVNCKDCTLSNLDCYRFVK